jgi:hypothetical protein
MTESLQLNDIAAEAARSGDTVKIRTRLYLTSDNHPFHRVVASFSRHIRYVAEQAGHSVNLKRADVALLVVHSGFFCSLRGDPSDIDTDGLGQEGFELLYDHCIPTSRPTSNNLAQN